MTKQCGAVGIAILLALMGNSVTSAAQRGRRDGPQSNPQLAAVKGLKCSFQAAAGATWQDGAPQVTTKKTGTLTITISEIDTTDGTAQLNGTGGVVFATAKLAGSNLHFLDMRPGGALTVTTIFAQESHDGRLKAVHTRTDYLAVSFPGFSSEPEVSQYYGDCEVVQ